MIFTGNWKHGYKDGYGVQESYSLTQKSGKLMRDQYLITTVLDGSWKEGKFHGWGRLLVFEELDELLGIELKYLL